MKADARNMPAAALILQKLRISFWGSPDRLLFPSESAVRLSEAVGYSRRKKKGKG